MNMIIKKRRFIYLTAAFLAVALAVSGFAIMLIKREKQSGNESVTQQFCTYLQELIADNRWEELEQHIISRELTYEEAAERAEASPLLSNFAEYGEYFFSTCKEMLLVEADINKDGNPDIIEYIPDAGDLAYGAANLFESHKYEYGQNILTFFEGEAGGGFHTMYYEPWLDIRLERGGKIQVAEYEDSIYVLFINDNEKIWICRMEGCGFEDRIILEMEYGTVSGEIVECREEYTEKAQDICSNAAEYFNVSDYDQWLEGTAETHLEKESDESDLLKGITWEKEREYKQKYFEPAGRRNIYYNSADEYAVSRIWRSDIDNDGLEEVYAKAVCSLNLVMQAGNYFYPFLTGELYGDGRHEGREGLEYTIAKNGEGEDLESLCGLDIWAGEDTPQMFWVDRCGAENIIFILYKELWTGGCGRVEGYDIRAGKYEKIMEVRYVPEFSFHEEYEQNEGKAGYPPYTVRLYAKTGKAEIVGMKDRKLQENINNKIEVLLWESLMELVHQRNASFDGNVNFNVLAAERDKLKLYVIINYGVGSEDGYGEELFMEVNLKDGKVYLTEPVMIEEERGW